MPTKEDLKYRIRSQADLISSLLADIEDADAEYAALETENEALITKLTEIGVAAGAVLNIINALGQDNVYGLALVDPDMAVFEVLADVIADDDDDDDLVGYAEVDGYADIDAMISEAVAQVYPNNSAPFSLDLSSLSPAYGEITYDEQAFEFVGGALQPSTAPEFDINEWLAQLFGIPVSLLGEAYPSDDWAAAAFAPVELSDEVIVTFKPEECELDLTWQQRQLPPFAWQRSVLDELDGCRV